MPPILYHRPMRFHSILFVLFLILLAACGGAETYSETFDEPGSWRTGEEADVTGEVADGVYRFNLKPDNVQIWTTADQDFKNGVFSVEATQTAGEPDSSGYGMMLRVDDSTDSFYLFEISSDGLAWVARCLQACSSSDNTSNLIGDWWFDSAAIKQGIGETNVLKVEANNANFVFSVNDIEVGRVTDPILASGDIGLFVEAIDGGNLEYEFDNFKVEPLP